MIDAALYAGYSSALDANADLLESAVAFLADELGGLSGDALEKALAARYAALAKTYGGLAAAVAVDFYSRLREMSGAAESCGDYTAAQAGAAADAVLFADVGRALRGASGAGMQKLLQALGAQAVRRSMEQVDDTLFLNMGRDPAHPLWALVPRPGACGWCVMIGSQGFVYHSDKTLARSRHPSCRCAPVVDFDTENPSLEGYDVGALRNSYASCRDAVEYDVRRAWDAMTDEQRAAWGGMERGAYDHYKRNRIVAEMNARDREWLRTGKACSVASEEGARPSAREKGLADQLAANGFDVKFRATRGADGRRTSDVYLNGIDYEMKQPTGNGRQTIYHQFEEAAGQSENLILDVTDTGGRWGIEATRAAAGRYLGWHFGDKGDIGFNEVLLVYGNHIERIKRRS